MNPVKTQVQAWIGYAILALFLATGSLALTFYIKGQGYRLALAQQASKLDTALTRVATVEDANATQAEAIKAIRDANENSGLLLQSLSQAISNLNSNDKVVRNRLDYLEKNDEAIRDYFSNGVPAGVACLLDKTCDPDGNGLPAAKQGPVGSVPKPDVKAHPPKQGSGR